MRLVKPSRTVRSELLALRDQQRRTYSTSAFTGSGITPDGLGGLEPGSISSSAVTSPTVPGIAGTETSGVALTTTLTEVLGIDLVTPDSCTQLLFAATGHVYASNPGADDALWVAINAAGTTSTPIGVPLAASNINTASTSMATALTGLTPGGTVRLGLWASTSLAPIAADPANVAMFAATLTWKP